MTDSFAFFLSSPSWLSWGLLEAGGEKESIGTSELKIVRVKCHVHATFICSFSRSQALPTRTKSDGKLGGAWEQG